MNELDLKSKKIQTTVKLVGLAIIGLIIAPFIMVAIGGLIGGFVALAIGYIGINMLPWFALKVANWRIKSIKHEAMKNPVETLQNQYVQKKAALKDYATNIEMFASQVLTFSDQVRQYLKEGLEDADVYVEQLEKMKHLLKLRQQKYQEAQDALAEFDETIKRTDRKWKMACAAMKMNEAAGELEGDVFDKICIETALESVQTKLNQSFASLDVILMDNERTTRNNDRKNKPAQLDNKVIDVTPIPATVVPKQITGVNR